MGADMVLAICPAWDTWGYTYENIVTAIEQSLGPDELRACGMDDWEYDITDRLADGHDYEDEDNWTDATLKLLIEDAGKVFGPDAYGRQVTHLLPRHWGDGYEWLATGGMSWGDEPTDIYHCVDRLAAVHEFITAALVETDSC